MKRIVSINCLLIALTWCAKAQQRSVNQPLADSLVKWAVLDQTAAGPREGKFKLMTSAQRTHYCDSVFAANERRLEMVFTQYGFPGYDIAGEKGSNSFWLMTQHCDKDVAFQQKILAAMKPEVVKHNADPKNFAYLTDRVNLNTGRKQIYGTQVTYRTDSCQAIPKPLADSLQVNERREDVGLEKIETYLNEMSQMHFDMNKTFYEKKGIRQPTLIPESH